MTKNSFEHKFSRQTSELYMQNIYSHFNVNCCQLKIPLYYRYIYKDGVEQPRYTNFATQRQLVTH